MKWLDNYYVFMFSFVRHDFYSQLADAIRRRVSLKAFVSRYGENAKILKDDTCIHISKMLMKKIESSKSVTIENLLDDLVPKSDLPLIRAAIYSTDIPSAFEHIAKVVIFKQTVQKQIMLYSVGVIFMLIAGGAIALLMAQAVAMIEESMPDMRFTGFNSFVVNLSNFINTWSIEIIISTVVVAAAIVFLMPRLTGKYRSYIDDLPILGIYRDYQSANAIASLSMLLSSGMVLKVALTKLADKGSPWVKWQVAQIIQALDRNPNKLLHAFSLGLFSKPLRSRLASLTDSSDSFDKAIIHLGGNELARIETQTQTAIKAASVTIVFSIAIVASILALGQNTIILEINQATSNNMNF